VAALFRSVAEGETGHAFGHFDFLKEVGDPVTGVPVGPTTEDNLKSAIEGETYEYTEMYPGFAKTARDEGLEEVAEWLETLARAEKSHAGRFTQGLESVSYERERDEFRSRVIAAKKLRRISVGPVVTLTFESRLTMRFQVQEMARAEKMITDEQIQHELDVYNRLLPSHGELSATLFLELTTEEELRTWLPPAGRHRAGL
jgi:rubrerythrin